MRRVWLLVLALLLIPNAAIAAEPSIVPGSNINVVARDARIPVTVTNPTDQDIEVTVMAASNSFRLEIIENATLIVPARSSAVAELPIKAIANGPLEISVWLSVEGNQIGDTVVVEVIVNYDIELFLLVSFGVAMFALIVIGVIRTTSKLRRQPRE
ncbi:MAG: hypothetical protein HQ484_02930 [Candidatus Aquiluna sp.]|uniref:DUF6049 family protein n=1 Tax=Aquiluna sp. TaxID=2053504 RepID=UPI000712F2CA|nr:MAG: hypothetical protein ABR68_02755 [Microbacteriaceae bacterium BACL28 MAG-120531-bin53]NQV92620.1 hypothetical protein [Aquiluna sp.]